MKRTLSGIIAASLVLGAVEPTSRVRTKGGRLTGGYKLEPVAYRGGNRQTFKTVAGRKRRGRRR